MEVGCVIFGMTPKKIKKDTRGKNLKGLNE
jgi:hypothetical protein